MRFAVWVLFAGLMLTGCAWFGQQKPATTVSGQTGTTNTAVADSSTNRQPIVTPDSTSSGTIVQVNVPARFAVLNFPVGSMPPIGQRLYVYRAGLKVGELKVTGPQRDDNTVADIINGEAQSGDIVRSQ